jgi:Golgi phosphoprotein 3 (GPP34)
MAPDRMPLHHQLFLAGHDPDGQLRVHPTTMRLGLAAAVMAELVLADNIQVTGDRFWVLAITGVVHPDALAEATRTAMRHDTSGRLVSHWLRVMAGSVYDRVSGGLLAAGLVVRETRRREVRYPQTNTNITAQRIGELRAAITGHQVAHPAVLALAGLFALLRLEGQLGFAAPSADVLYRLTKLHAYSSSAVREVVIGANNLVGESALSAYR